MTKQDTVDVLIIGSGPAGMSVALYLIQADPRWATRILVVEKAVHPPSVDYKAIIGTFHVLFTENHI